MRTGPLRPFSVIAALLVAVAGITACGDDDSSSDDAVAGSTTTTTATTADGDQVSIPVVTVTTSQSGDAEGADRYSFSLTDDLTAGPTQINLRNEGPEPHHVQVFKLDDGVTMDQFGEVLASGDESALLGVGAFVGGTGTADPGSDSKADALIDLGEGNYVLLCFIPDAEGVPHLANGMVEPFTVGPADGGVADMPTPDATVELVDFGFDNSDLPSSGVIEVVNASDAQPHEMNVLQLAEGAELAEVADFFEAPEGPPPFASIGGMQALMPGGSSFLVLEDLDPGDYVLICHIPDPTDGVPHSAKGMAITTTVT